MSLVVQGSEYRLEKYLIGMNWFIISWRLCLKRSQSGYNPLLSSFASQFKRTIMYVAILYIRIVNYINKQMDVLTYWKSHNKLTNTLYCNDQNNFTQMCSPETARRHH